jgi:chromosome segregation ATPase
MPAEPAIGALPFVPPPSPVTTEARPDTPGVRTGKWGVTTTQTASYEPNGTRIARLAGGTVVEVQGAVSSSRGSMTICRYRQNGSWQGPVLISEADLAFFSGSVADFPAETLEALQRYFEAKGLVDARTAELTRQQVDANPYTAPYRQAYEQLTALQERAKTLTAERDNASGEARMRAIEELRLMKDEQARLRAVFDQAQTQYRTWKSEHATTSSVDPATDPQIQAWERRMAALKPDVRKVLPAP